MAPISRKEQAYREILNLRAEGFSQYEIARGTGVSRGQIFNILSGRAGIGEKSIAAVLGSRKQQRAMLVLREQGKVQKQIAEREIRRLQAEGFSQREIARRTNVSRRQLRDILSGRRGVGEKTIAAVIESRKTGQAMLLLRDYGSVWVQPANAANRSLLGSYWHALGVARETGDRSLLEKFKNRTVTVIERGRRGRLKLVTDPAILGRLEDQHQLAPKEVTHYDLRRAKRGRGE